MGFDDNIIETFNPVREMLSGINTRSPSEKLGAVGNKLLSFHSNMSVFRHKYMDSCGEMMVSSGIKTRDFMAL